jgi:hypothetical protein
VYFFYDVALSLYFQIKLKCFSLIYRNTATQQPRTDKKTMATTTMMTPDNHQFDWNHHQLETGNPTVEEEEATTTTYNGGDYDDQEEPAFNKAASNRATTSNAERRYQRRSPPPRTTPAISAHTTVNDAIVNQAHECVQKPKTRAERRAIEPEQVEETPAEVRRAKRERRSDYWVQRDDERRNAARTFKTQTQSQVLSEGEGGFD